jgi:polyisoprenoid-binding protein YceI
MNLGQKTYERYGCWRGCALLTLLAAYVVSVAAQDTKFQLDPAQTAVKFTLGDVLHTVHGTFQLKSGELQFEPASGKISGQIVVDAKSGESGSGMRDRKMEMSGDHWTATVRFTVAYAKWGMKNPSTLFLRVNDSVEIDLVAAGNVAKRSTLSSAQ